MRTEKQSIHNFCILAASAGHSLGVSTVVRDAIACPGVYVFGELLSSPAVMKMHGSPEQNILDMLVVFAYGSMKDYEANASILPALTDQERQKLMYLTVLSQATNCREISYSVLMDEPEIKSVRELEDVVIDLIYENLLKGTLDQRRQTITVDFAASRDVPEPRIMQLSNIKNLTTVPSLETMLSALGAWKQNANELLDGIVESVKLVVQNDERMEQNAKLREEEIANMRRAIRNSNSDFWKGMRYSRELGDAWNMVAKNDFANKQWDAESTLGQASSSGRKR